MKILDKILTSVAKKFQWIQFFMEFPLKSEAISECRVEIKSGCTGIICLLNLVKFAVAVFSPQRPLLISSRISRSIFLSQKKQPSQNNEELSLGRTNGQLRLPRTTSIY